eukprot:gene12277-16368_t
MLLRVNKSPDYRSICSKRLLIIRFFSSNNFDNGIRSIFLWDRPRQEKQMMLDALLSRENIRKLRPIDIAIILQSSAKSRLRINDANKLAVELSKSKEKVTMITLSRCIYGLKAIKKGSEKNLLQLIVELALKVRTCNDTFGAQAVGNMLYGLQNLSSDKKEVLEL